MKLSLSALFKNPVARIFRILEIVFILLSIFFFLYAKANPVALHYEGADFTAGTDDSADFVLSDISLKRGLYNVTLSAVSTSGKDTFGFHCDSLAGTRFCFTDTVLGTTTAAHEMTVELKGSADDLTAFIDCEDGSAFDLIALDIIRTTATEKRGFVIAVFFCLILEFILWFIRQEASVKKITFFLGGVFLVCCYPLMCDYIGGSHDILFHLARIEGIYKGLVSGTFPVKVQPFWGNDYGYAVGVFYGEALLYFPAVLRIFGFSVMSAYKIYTAAIQLFTVIISYFCFKSLFKSEKTGLVGCALYSLSIYRLMNTYTRAAIGEFTAMMFLPVVLLGFYMILSDSREASGDKKPGFIASLKAPLITAIGLTGLIGCHILSCEMIAFFILIALLVFIKRVFKASVFMNLLKALGLTIIFNLGFIIAFIDFFFQPLNIRSENWAGGSPTGIQEQGISPLQLFALFTRSTGGSFVTTPGIANEVGYCIGFVFLALVALFVYFVLFDKEKIYNAPLFKLTVFSTVLGAVSLFMSTQYFPWNALFSIDFLSKPIATIQFPWRFLSFGTLFLTVTGCFVFENLSRVWDATKAFGCALFLAVILFIGTGHYLSDFVFTAEPYRVYDSYDLYSGAFYSEEYLLEGTDIHAFRPDDIVCSNCSLTAYSKSGTNISFTASTPGGGSICLPLNYYKHYRAVDASGNALSIHPGYNNEICVSLPEGFDSSVDVSFAEPFIWRFGEAVSYLSLLGALIIAFLGKRKKIW